MFNYFYRSRNFIKFIKNKKNFNYISSLTIKKIKSRCLDKIDKRTLLSLNESSQSLISKAKSITFMTNSEISSNKTLMLEDIDLNFIMNEDLALENR